MIANPLMSQIWQKKKNPWLLSTLKTTLISGEGLV
jgi:hypothetical protein